ncbi:hypothetical protein ACVHYJ_17335 [Burkholderia pyrrocinia]
MVLLQLAKLARSEHEGREQDGGRAQAAQKIEIARAVVGRFQTGYHVDVR